MLAMTMVAALLAQDGFVEQYTATYGFRLGAPRRITVTPQGDAVLFLRAVGARSFTQDLLTFDPVSGTERVLLTAERVLQGEADALSETEKAQREREREAAAGITRYQLSKDGITLLVPIGGQLYVVARASGRARVLPSKAGRPVNATFSPNGKLVAAVRGRDLYVSDVGSGVETRLTEAKSDTVSYGLPEFVAAEEMDRSAGYWWSPDSKRLAVARVDEAPVEQLWRLDPTKPEQAARGARFPRAGTDNADVTLWVMGIDGTGRTEVKWDRAAWPYLTRVKWTKHGPLTLVVQSRDQRQLLVLAADDTGKTRTLLTETDDAWLNLQSKFPLWRADGFLWASERTGRWTVDLHDKDGKRLRTVVPAELNFRGYLYGDTKAVYVTGGEDPTQAHVYRIPAAGDPVRMTKAAGQHGAVFGRGAKLWVHTFAGPDGTRKYTVRRGPSAVAGLLKDVAEPLPFAPKPAFTTVDVDGRTHHAVIIRPREFDAKRRYPVLVHVYGGPHAQMVTQSGRRYLRDQWYADHGYIVVATDGRGTPARGRAWERAIRLDLISKPLADQVAVLQALGKRHHELDLSRVGMYGWSFGGYFSAMAVLLRPDVFHAGVAGAPVTDWHDYDTFYTERYMGLPAENADGYASTSALTHAAKLTRPLLIIHGTGDDNVYYTHSLKLSDALLKAGKHHELLTLSGFTHMVADPVYAKALQGRILGHFERHLGAKR